MQIQNSIWLITGTSTGFGKLLAYEVLKRGGKVVATARKTETVADLAKSYPDRVLALQLDVTNPQQVQSVVEQSVARFGRIDVLVNNAGFGITGAIEEVSDAEARDVFETNVFGLLHVTRAALPQLRQQRAGHILQLSSVAGMLASPGWGIYQASKHAVEGLSEALAQEVAPLGIKLTIVEPGPFRTEFLAAGRSVRFAKTELPDYAATAGGSRIYARDKHGIQPGDPQKAVEAMIAVVESETPPLRLPLGNIAVDRIRKKLADVERDIAAWETVARGADFAKS
jgi:NAD(P)-dependent dehydrogenase (short-subunit alcohol dehydrogenase family)